MEIAFSMANELSLESLCFRCLKSIAIWVYQVFTAILAVATIAERNGLDKYIRCISSIIG